MRRFAMLLAGTTLALAQPAAPTGPTGPTDIFVRADAATGGTGSPQKPFRNIDDAVAKANAVGGGITIRLAPGDYPVSGPLTLTVTGVTVRGSMVPLEDTRGLLNGLVSGGTQTRILATAAVDKKTLLTVGRDGDILGAFEMSGVEFNIDRSNPTSVIKPVSFLDVKRTNSAAVHEVIFACVPETVGLGTYATSGSIRHNYFTNCLSGAALAGGYTGAPSDLTYVGNRAESNQNGLLLVGTSDGIPEPGYLINADIRDNDFLKNNITPADPVTSLRYNNGIRMIVKGREPSQGIGGLFGHVIANVVGNSFTDNSRAVEVDAGFPYRTYPNGDCDWRTFTGLVDATFKSNTLAIGNAPQFITFTRQNAVGKPAQAKLYKYLRGATYTLIDPDNTFAFGVTPPVDDPNQDPGTCTEGGDLNNQALLFP